MRTFHKTGWLILVIVLALVMSACGATAATPSTSQRDGSGARLSAKYMRHPYRQRVSNVSHHGARKACGAITTNSEPISHARSRAFTALSSGASG